MPLMRLWVYKMILLTAILRGAAPTPRSRWAPGDSRSDPGFRVSSAHSQWHRCTHRMPTIKKHEVNPPWHSEGLLSLLLTLSEPWMFLGHSDTSSVGKNWNKKTTRAKRLSKDHSQKEPGRIVFPRESKITDFEVTGDVGQEVVARPWQLLENKSWFPPIFFRANWIKNIPVNSTVDF